MRLLAIDGNSILNRAFYGIKTMLSNKKGIPTNAVFGFMNIYLKNVRDIQPDCIAAAFDLHAPTFRHKADANYKANRHAAPDDLIAQFPVIKEILKYMGVKVLECEGYEADDILGTLAEICTKSGNFCDILTGDKDSLQLVNENVTVHLAGNNQTTAFTPETFREKYGFEPENLKDLKALMGDSSDNIKGVEGIGEKTAMKLIQQWHNLDCLYENIDNAGLTKSVYNKLTAGKESAYHSKWLATIVTDVPVETDIEKYSDVQPDNEKLLDLLKELEMYRLIDQLKLVKTESIDMPEFSERNFSELKYSENETADFLFTDDTLTVIRENTIYKTQNKDEILNFFNSDVRKRTFSAKSGYRYSFENNCELKGICFDAKLAGYLLSPESSEYTIENLCRAYEVHYFSDILSLPSLCSNLYDILKEQKLLEVLEKIEIPFTEVLASMEYYGIRVNSDGVKQFGESLKDDIEALEEQIYFMAGERFNILSPRQLGVILFEKMNLPVIKKTKTGYSTNAEVLEQLRDKDPIIDLILKYRQYTKLLSTYVDGLLKTVKPDGRIHSVFRQTETRTGRISSTEPNMQNIPVRTELGRNMRKFFIADEGKILLDADYSQIELRIMAHMSNDQTMQEAFKNNADIHTITASQVFGVPENSVTPFMRSSAKAVNFGIIYGIGAFSLAKDINVSKAEAKRYIEGYFKKYPNVEKFMNDTVESAEKNGYVTTIFGRKRNIPEIQSRNKVIKAAGKRIAMNTPVQGTAADIIKIAMINVYKRLKEENLNAHLILQVHDELIVETSPESAEMAGKILSSEMVNACKLNVPLIADVKEGFSWYDAKE